MELHEIKEELGLVYAELRPLDKRLPRCVEPIYLADPTIDLYLHGIAVKKVDVRKRLTALLNELNKQ